MIYLSFKEYINKHKRKNEATRSMKILSEVKLSANIYMRDDNFNTKIGIVNLHPTKGTQWVYL